MTLFEKIEYMARLGKDSIIQSPNGYKMIVFHWRDADGDFMESGWSNNFSNTKINYGVPRCTWDEREAEGWKFIGESPRPELERFKVGDKVKVTGEDYVYSIASVDDNMVYTLNRMITDSKSFLYVFDTNGGLLLGRKQAHHDQLTPVFEEEPAEEQEEPEKQEQKTITIDGIEYYLTPKR